MRLVMHILNFFSKKEYSIEIRKCECGKTFKVYHNLYSSKSGRGSCECGCKVIIN